MTARRVLGISLGSRSMGIAVFDRYSLFDWWMRSFNERWSEQKLKKILGVIAGYIDDYKISAVAVKVPTLSVDAPAIEALLAGIERLAESKGIEVYKYSLREIKAAWAGNDKINKRELMCLILLKYPELQREYEKDMGNKAGYYEMVFEGIAVAVSLLSIKPKGY